VVPEPGKTICLGLNYFDHAQEGGRKKPEYPWFFLRAKSSLIGHGRPAICPKVSSEFDYEAELAVIIGRDVPRHVRAGEALAYVFGYACFNDISVRDYQKRTPQWTIGKNFDGTGGFGPWVVTADALPPGATGLRIQSYLNGTVMQDANTSEMIFGAARPVLDVTSGRCALDGHACRCGFRPQPADLAEAGRLDRGRDRAHRCVVEPRRGRGLNVRRLRP
jgi:2-keto-4-pentenoate hydratase/2-oxohepta-3-ene-1,7-dioic acid hydratase in catechol pathway